MHILSCIRRALSRPRIALLGAREFRSTFTTHFADYHQLEAYDSGRELAHWATFRCFEPF